MVHYKKEKQMGYHYYRTYFADKAENDYKMLITPDGVSLEYRDGRVLRTLINTKEFFPGQSKLTPKDINKLHRFIKYYDYKIGTLYDKKTMDKIYKQYLKQTKNLGIKE